MRLRLTPLGRTSRPGRPLHLTVVESDGTRTGYTHSPDARPSWWQWFFGGPAQPAPLAGSPEYSQVLESPGEAP